MKKLLPKISFRLRKGFFSMLLIVFGVVFVWRGLWNLMDMYVLPDDPILGNVLGILIGISLLYMPDDDIKELV